MVAKELSRPAVASLLAWSELQTVVAKGRLQNQLTVCGDPRVLTLSSSPASRNRLMGKGRFIALAG